MGNDINCAYFCSWIHLIIMKVLRWRMRAFEGEVIGKEFKGKEKINIWFRLWRTKVSLAVMDKGILASNM